MSAEAVKTLVQAFISCRLDYCNSLFIGIVEGLMSRLQSVQNATARLVSGARRYDRITPVLQELHWLQVRRRTVYLSLSGRAPAYLAADCQLVSDEGRCQLRSATSKTCVVRRTYSNYGDRRFAAAELQVRSCTWNSLPTELRQADIIAFNDLSDY